MEYGIAEAKNNLPKLVKAAKRGERVVITNRGAAVAELVPVVPKTRKGFGSMPGLTDSFPPGWDSIEEEDKITAMFEDLH